MNTIKNSKYVLITSEKNFRGIQLYRVCIQDKEGTDKYIISDTYVDNMDTLIDYCYHIAPTMLGNSVFYKTYDDCIIRDDSSKYIIRYNMSSDRVISVFHKAYYNKTKTLDIKIEDTVSEGSEKYNKIGIGNETYKFHCYINTKLPADTITAISGVVSGSYIDPIEDENYVACRDTADSKVIVLLDIRNYYYDIVNTDDICLTINGEEFRLCGASKEYIKNLLKGSSSNDNSIKKTNGNIKFGDFENLKDTIKDTLNKAASKASEIAESIDNDKELSEKKSTDGNKIPGLIKEERMDGKKYVNQMIEYAKTHKTHNGPYITDFDKDIINPLSNRDGNSSIKRDNKSLMIYITSNIKIKDIKRTLKNLKSVIDQYDTVDIFISFSLFFDVDDNFRSFINDKIWNIIGRDRSGVIRNTVVLEFEAFKYIKSYDFCIALYSTDSKGTVESIMDNKSLRNKTMCILCRERGTK